MPASATLVRTTRFGARPLGVRGEPLHNTHAQIRDVVRRRLGDRHRHLLAEPQAWPATGQIDWYADGEPVQAATDLPEEERAALRTEIDGMLADIDRLGAGLEASPGEDARLAGRALRLATRRPESDEYLFRVGGQPVLICWGYDQASVGAILPPAFLAGATAATAPVATATPAATALPAAAAVPVRRPFPWLAVLLAGLLGIALILGTAWLLRLFLPVPPDLQVTQLPPEPPPPPPPAPPDPTLELKAAVDAEREREDKLKAALVALRDEFRQRQALCKPPEPPPPPPEPPKPPVVERKPPPAPKPPPKPQVAEKPRPPPPPPPPPVTAPPPGMMPCNVETASGGAGVTRNRHYLGNKPGPVTIRYNMKMIPDQMNIYYRGRLVATTNRPTSFFGGLRFDFQPVDGDYSVVVEVVGPHHGTEWSYRLDCPA